MTARDHDGARSAARELPGSAADSSDSRTAHALKTWVVLARAYAAVARAVEADIAQHGLTTTEFGILEALHHKGPLLLGEIQRKVLVTSGGITYLVDRLVAKGLVTREPSPDDRRARYAVLTAEGKQLIAQIFPAHAAFLEEMLSTLNEREQGEATALLRKLGLGAAARAGDSA
jgi:MarR family 2-MHQ and catechol resistance regulon transcriptional repressor